MEKFDFEFLGKDRINYKFLFLFFAIMAVALYVGFLIYGNRGLSRLLDLENTKQVMTKEVNELKKQNVQLQKEYFGLKEIEDR